MLSKKIFLSIQTIKQNNIMCLGIDPGVHLGIAIFAITNINSPILINTKHIISYQINYKKEIDFFNQDTRLHKITKHIEDILITYKINIVSLEQSSYSIGKFSYSENLLAKYVGAIYSIILTNNIKIIEISHKLMQKIITSTCTSKKNKLAIKTKIEKIYPYEINMKHLDHLDALGYCYSIYLIIKIYYKYKLNY